MNLRSSILAVVTALALLTGVCARAELTQTTSFFIPAYLLTTVYGSYDGIYLELRPGGKVVTVEIESPDVGGCEGTYVVDGARFIITLSVCGKIQQSESGEISVFPPSAKAAEYLVTQELEILDGPVSLDNPRVLKMIFSIKAVSDRVLLSKSREGIALGVNGNFMTVLEHLKAVNKK